jgi:hypothetical protein
MPMPPNWAGIAAFAMLGVVNPGFWMIGAGLELGYLLLLAGNSRFQRLIDGRDAAAVRAGWEQRIDAALQGLDSVSRRRYLGLRSRCAGLLEHQFERIAGAGNAEHLTGLNRLLWIYLRLMLAGNAIRQVIESAPGHDDRIEAQVAEVDSQLEDAGLGDELRRSLEGQRDILRQRLDKRREGAEKLAFVESELNRIEQQVELIREQSALIADPETLTRRIDEVAAAMGETGRWIRDQQRIYGAIEELAAEPPVMISMPSATESERS